MARTLKTIAQFAEVTPFTEAQIRWWIFNEQANGMGGHGVVVRIGRRIYIDVDGFDRWVDQQNGAAGYLGARH